MDVIDTDGVILPGLIDLHGHPEFNVFAAWEPRHSTLRRRIGFSRTASLPEAA